MARGPRFDHPGALHHVTARGIVGRALFADHGDHYGFLVLLARAAERYGWQFHGFCLMTTHYHLVMETPEANLSRGMHWLNGTYAQRHNSRHGRPGHVFEGRFKAVVVEHEPHLYEVVRYVVLNPVRAGICDSPEGWPWSSYAATAGLQDAPSFLRLDRILPWFGKETGPAQAEFRRFVDLALPGARSFEVDGHPYVPSSTAAPR
jgi:REP element-mobilizing transposase RayT